MAQEKRDQAANTVKSRILIVDDHPIVRQGLARLIDSEGDLTVCGHAENVYAAMKAVRTLNRIW